MTLRSKVFYALIKSSKCIILRNYFVYITCHFKKFQVATTKRIFLTASQLLLLDWRRTRTTMTKTKLSSSRMHFQFAITFWAVLTCDFFDLSSGLKSEANLFEWSLFVVWLFLEKTEMWKSMWMPMEKKWRTAPPCQLPLWIEKTTFCKTPFKLRGYRHT